MRTARLLPCMVLTVVAAGAVSATSWPDPAINPFQTPPSRVLLIITSLIGNIAK
jgi:hypothetical protein